MADRGQVTGDKCGIVTWVVGAGDENCCGCRVGDTSALNETRKQNWRRAIRVIEATTHRIRRVIAGNAATELVSDISGRPRCFHPPTLASGLPARSSQGVVAETFRTDRPQTGKEDKPGASSAKAVSKRPSWCAYGRFGFCRSSQPGQGVSGAFWPIGVNRFRTALLAALSAIRRYCANLPSLNISGKVS